MFVPQLVKERGKLAHEIFLIGVYRNILNKHAIATPYHEYSLLFDADAVTAIVNSELRIVTTTVTELVNNGGALYSCFTALHNLMLMARGDIYDLFLNNASEHLDRLASNPSAASSIASCFDEIMRLRLNSSMGIIDKLFSKVSMEPLQNIHQPVLPVLEHILRFSLPSSSQSISAPSAEFKIVDVLSLNMEPAFPYRLLISRTSMSKYSLLFRFLFSCTHLSKQLTDCSMEGHSGREQMDIQRMKFTMLSFIRTILHYSGELVIQPKMQAFRDQLVQSTSIEEIKVAHEGSLDSCLRECMLSNPKIVQIMSLIFASCRRFVAIASSSQTSDPQQQYGKLSTIYGQYFTKYVRTFLDALQYYAARDCDHYLDTLMGHFDHALYSQKS